jgi:hypothetical protein
MTEALAAALAFQLTLAASAKWRTRRERGQTQLDSLLPRVPVEAYIVGDAICAGLLLIPATAAAAAIAVLAVSTGTAVLGIISADGREKPCGCFGVPAQTQPRWHGDLTTILVAAEAILVVAAHLRVLSALARPAGWWWAVGAVLTVGFLILQPQVVTTGRRTPGARGEAVRTLATSPALDKWRPLLLSEVPSSVTIVGRSVQVVLDAWSGDRPILLVATVTGNRVRIQPYDAASLNPVSPTSA